MVDCSLGIHEDDNAPSVLVERRRRSLALRISSLLIVDGLCRKGSLYRKLPMEPLKLSVLKLDGSCFGNLFLWFVSVIVFLIIFSCAVV